MPGMGSGRRRRVARPAEAGEPEEEEVYRCERAAAKPRFRGAFAEVPPGRLGPQAQPGCAAEPGAAVSRAAAPSRVPCSRDSRV
jgi:hypothetical protein